MPQASRGWRKEGFPHDRKRERQQRGQRGLPRGTSSYKELEGDERRQFSAAFMAISNEKLNP